METNTLSLPIKIPETELNKFCETNLISKLSLFGSVLRELNLITIS
jgi:predicted nucleotidyltransferase